MYTVSGVFLPDIGPVGFLGPQRLEFFGLLLYSGELYNYTVVYSLSPLPLSSSFEGYLYTKMIIKLQQRGVAANSSITIVWQVVVRQSDCMHSLSCCHCIYQPNSPTAQQQLSICPHTMHNAMYSVGLGCFCKPSLLS